MLLLRTCVVWGRREVLNEILQSLDDFSQANAVPQTAVAPLTLQRVQSSEHLRTNMRYTTPLSVPHHVFVIILMTWRTWWTSWWVTCTCGWREPTCFLLVVREKTWDRRPCGLPTARPLSSAQPSLLASCSRKFGTKASSRSTDYAAKPQWCYSVFIKYSISWKVCVL